MSTFKQKVLFTKDECDLILQLYKDKKTEYIQSNSDVTSFTYNALNEVTENWVLDRLIKWIESEIDVTINWNTTYKKEFYIHSYNKGDKFAKHMDSGAQYNRVYSMGLLLNDEFEGGDFVVDINTNKSISANKQIGNCYLFDSSLQHEVKEITNGNRNVVLVFFVKEQIVFNKMNLI
jgi:predicted 2-oxoglutarate/Fe(II)-dependent dioxygenase YbiX